MAVAVFTSTPAILAHAGLVTTDMALVGTLVATLYTFTLWHLVQRDFSATAPDQL